MPITLHLENSTVRLVSRTELLARGYSRHRIDARVRSGALQRVGNGVYLEPPVPLTYRSSNHQVKAIAASMSARGPVVVSHSSAALLHGLPDWQLPLGRVCVTVDSPRNSSAVNGPVYRKCGPLSAREIVQVHGIAVTSVERTLLDVATSCPFAAGVVTIEAALHRRLVQRERLVAYFESKRGLKNLHEGIQALAFASGRSESPLESRSRLFLDHFGIEMPEQQAEIVTASGRRYRVDFLWRGRKLIGEADGKGKILGGDAAHGRQRLREHWQREEELRAEGYTFVRWTWEDLDDPAALLQRIESAMAMSARAAA